MEPDEDQILSRVYDVIHENQTVGQRMRQLIAACVRRRVSDVDWPRVRAIGFDADARLIQRELEARLHSGQVQRRHSGFYFGLDGLNMKSGKGIEFGCSPNANRSASNIDWAWECDVYPGDIASPALGEMYDAGIELGSAADYLLCLSYSGMALKAAMQGMDRKTALGGRGWRGIAWGFHDGDLYRLGTLTLRGWQRGKIATLPQTYRPPYKIEPRSGTRLGQFYRLQPWGNPWFLEFEDYYRFTEGKQVVASQPVRLRVSHRYNKTDITLLIHPVPIVNEKAAKFIRSAAAGDVELVPAKVEGERGRYFVVNVLSSIAALVPGQDNTTPSWDQVVDPKAVETHQMFRPAEDSLSIIVTERFRRLLTASGLTGAGCEPVLSRA